VQSYIRKSYRVAVIVFGERFLCLLPDFRSRLDKFPQRFDRRANLTGPG
jgi:hypothetical protein